jgi:dolichyl-phosphooligosaccharide-protein glycotransferase
VKSRRVQILIPILELLILFGIALFIRIYLPYKGVFTSNGIAFTGNDAYFHVRIVQDIINNFPHFPSVDPYLSFGVLTHLIPSFFQWLMAVVVWIIGLGSPSQHLLDVIAVYYPAVLGALTIIPAYFIGKELWGRHGHWAGIIAGALVAVLPGEFLGRSILGFSDQHVMETLLSTTAILFLIMAIKSARLRELSILDFRKLKWSKILRPSFYAILSGLFLGLYIFAWQGALLLVFAIAVFFIVQFVIDHLKGRQIGYLASVGIIIFLVSLIFIPVTPSSLYPPSIIIGLLIPVVLGILSYILAKRGINRVFYPLIIIVGGAAGVGLFYLINPTLLRSMLSAFNIFTPSSTLLATVEAQHIFTPLTTGGNLLDSPAWINFYFTLPVALIGLMIMLIQSVTKHGNAEKVAFIIWTLVMFIAMVGQRRFAYYFVVNVAILVGYVSVLTYYVIAKVVAYFWGNHSESITRNVLDLDGLTERKAAAEAIITSSSKKTRRRERQAARRQEIERRRMNRDQTEKGRPIRNYVSLSLSVIVIFMLIFSPLVVFADPTHNLTSPPTFATASSTPYAPGDAWMKSLAWMRDNTPEPLGSAEAYYKRYTTDFTYPASAYSVLAWWDYGYWITYIGHRIPVANPGQDPTTVTKVANYFIAQDEASAETMADEMKADYVVTDYQTATSKFWAMATWAGKSQSDYFEIFWDAKNNQQKLYIYPAFYQSMATRLYSFNGTAQTGLNPVVVEYTVRTTSQGSYKEIISENQFATYDEAIAYQSAQTSGDFVIVGNDVMVSPVPLQALQNYKLVFSSEAQTTLSSTGTTAQIKIFERSSE